jgi:hypothetical protein
MHIPTLIEVDSRARQSDEPKTVLQLKYCIESFCYVHLFATGHSKDKRSESCD